MATAGVVLAIIFLIIIAVWLGVISVIFIRFFAAYRKLTQGVSKKDLRSILTNLADTINTTGDQVNSVNKRVIQMEANDQLHLQKVGFVRFNPFADTGGNQSFVLCLLDGDDSGIVITSLHSRDQTRTYAKVINQGKPDEHEFSTEEQEAIKNALKKYKSKK